MSINDSDKLNKVVSSNILFRMQRQFQAVEVHTLCRPNTLRACLRTKRDISCYFQTGGVFGCGCGGAKLKQRGHFVDTAPAKRPAAPGSNRLIKKTGTEGGKQYLLIYDVC